MFHPAASALRFLLHPMSFLHLPSVSVRMPRKPRPARRADVCPAWSRAALVAVRLHFAARNRAGRSLPPPGATCSLPHFRFAQMWPRIFPRGLPGYVPLFHGWPRARTPAQAAAAASAPAVFAAAETGSSATRAAAAPRRMARMKCPARRQAMYISPPRLFSFVFSFSFFLLF